MQDNQVCEIHGEAIASAKAQMPDEDLLADMAELFKMFGDSSRVRIIMALRAGELCVCDVTEVVGAKLSAVSHQLRLLKQANLVKSRRDGREVYYSLDDEHVEKILALASEHLLEKHN